MSSAGCLSQRWCLTVAAACLACVLAACAPGLIKEADVRRLPFSLLGDAQNGVVSASGRWTRATSHQRSAVATLNAVEIVCSQQRRTCVEALAGLHSRLDPMFREATRGGLLLTSEMTEFSVVEWSSSTIRALAQPRAADIELRISLAERDVVRTATETSARGATGADPTPEVWKLE